MSKQLRYVEAADTRFWLLIGSPTKVPEIVRAPHGVLSYLREWADRVDPSHTAELPVGLQERPPDFFGARLLELPFAFVDGGLPATDYVTKRDCPPAQPATKYRPHNIVHVTIGVDAARRLGVAVRANLADLAAMAVPATGGTYRRTANVCVIEQSELHERARGIIWDTSKMLYDELGGYFAPADFAAPLESHLATERIFDELGDDFADQQLRHMLRTDIVFATNPSLGMIVSPSPSRRSTSIWSLSDATRSWSALCVDLRGCPPSSMRRWRPTSSLRSTVPYEAQTHGTPPNARAISPSSSVATCAVSVSM